MPWMPPIYGDDRGATIAMPFNRPLVASLHAAIHGVYEDSSGGYRLDGADARDRLMQWARGVKFDGPVAEERGRKVFSLAPIASRYLQATDDEILITTPLHQGIKTRLKTLSGSLWDPRRGAWVVPYRCAEALMGMWPQIEALAISQEPEQKQKAREEKRALNAPWRQEARRHRLLVIAGEEPPMGRLFVPNPTERLALVKKYSETFTDASGIKQYFRFKYQGPYRFIYYRLANKDEVMTCEDAIPGGHDWGWRTPHPSNKKERLRQIGWIGVHKRKPRPPGK